VKDYIIFNKKICPVVSCIIVFLPAFVGLLFNGIRSSFLAWLSFFILFALISSYVAAWIINLFFVRKLKDRFPEWKKEIIQSCYGRFRMFRSVIISGGDLPSFIQTDPDSEKIKAERDAVRTFSFCWIYIPTAMLLMLIMFVAFTSQ